MGLVMSLVTNNLVMPEGGEPHPSQQRHAERAAAAAAFFSRAWNSHLLACAW